MSDIPSAEIDRPARSGSPGLVLVLALLLVAVVVAFSVLPRDEAQRLILAFLALLAVVGVFALFAFAVGFIQFAGQGARNDLTKLLADTSAEGLLVTEGENQPIYANDTYMALSGARNAADLKLVDRLFSGAADVSEAVYRLALAAREGKRGSEELRISPPLLGEGPVAWYRVRVRPLERPGAQRATLWSVADITRERERHENVFQELQHAIDFLDHAPAGFFSSDAEGRISYMNATLAGWLDYDLAQVGTGGLSISDLVAGNGAALLAAVAGSPGDVRTEVLEVDLKRRNGQSIPVRLLHRVAFGQDATPGISRTLVLNRTSGEEPAEDLRAAEVRFARLFNSTPMAIASLDRSGHIVRSNAAFAKLIPQALKGDEGGRSIYAAVAERDRAGLEHTLAEAASGKSDIAPLDVMLPGEKEHSARLFFAASGEEVGPGDEPRVTLYALDTTEQRALQENFAQSQKMQAIGQLAGGVAHDFNNVLTAIIGFSDLLLANHRPTDPAFQDIMQIKQNANRAAGLVRQLLAFSRRQTLRPEVMNVGEALSELTLLLKRLLGERVALELKHGREVWPVKADVNQFEQVIVNLAVNARDAMPDGGKLMIRTENVTDPGPAAAADGRGGAPAGDHILIEVRDTGQGIPPELMEKIFEPFFTTKEI